MKVIGVFSGKGGVGKSTVASFLATALAKKHKVSLVDLDVNTPSIPVLFGRRREIGNLHIHSMGFERTGLLDFTGTVLRKTVRSLIEKAKKDESEVVVIDLPPGLTDVHLELVNVMKPSLFVLVVQPNKLSEEDAARTTLLFQKVKVPVVGVVQNMVGDIFEGYKEDTVLDLKILGGIPMKKEIATMGAKGKIDEVENPLEDLAGKLFKMAGEAEWKIMPKGLFEGPSFDDLYKSGELFKKEREGERLIPKKMKFYGLKSWEEIRAIMLGESDLFPNAARLESWPRTDETLELNDTETLRKMLEGLDEDNSGLFMIVRAPTTAIRLFPGEIGTAHLYLEGQHYYNLPRIAYTTDQGEVVLFAHEVKPCSIENLNQYIEEGTLVRARNSNAPRYIPTKEQLEMIGAAFGSRVGLTGDWEGDYATLCGSEGK